VGALFNGLIITGEIALVSKGMAERYLGFSGYQ